MNDFDAPRTLVLACLALTICIPASVRADPERRFAVTNSITIDTPRIPGPGGEVIPVRATPYPAVIEVDGFAEDERIQKITVTLHDLSHEVPDDIDMMLVGPEGQNIVLLSDAGGGFVDAGTFVTVTLDDDAEALLQDDEFFGSGTFRPANFELEDGDLFHEPAPQPSGASQLAVFAGTSPNGRWELYIVDDEVFDAGIIRGGWSITIWTGSSSPAFRRGDADSSASVNLTDAVFLLNALFQGGPRPECAEAADTDDTGVLDISDAVYLLDHLFRGGPGIPAPGLSDCGPDPTQDDLRCDSSLPCGGS